MIKSELVQYGVVMPTSLKDLFYYDKAEFEFLPVNRVKVLGDKVKIQCDFDKYSELEFTSTMPQVERVLFVRVRDWEKGKQVFTAIDNSQQYQVSLRSKYAKNI